MSAMTISDPKADLLDYLQGARGAMLWKLDGLTEYDARRPLAPTGTKASRPTRNCQANPSVHRH
jgi:predicted transcriptional regulator